MPGNKQFFRPQARRDAISIAIYISRDNPKVANEFLRSLEQTCKQLVLSPEIGTRRHYNNPLLKEVRMLPVNRFHNYLIFYKPHENGIEVIRVLHGARDLPRLFY